MRDKQEATTAVLTQLRLALGLLLGPAVVWLTYFIFSSHAKSDFQRSQVLHSPCHLEDRQVFRWPQHHSKPGLEARASQQDRTIAV